MKLYHPTTLIAVSLLSTTLACNKKIEASNSPASKESPRPLSAIEGEKEQVKALEVVELTDKKRCPSGGHILKTWTENGVPDEKFEAGVDSNLEEFEICEGYSLNEKKDDEEAEKVATSKDTLEMPKQYVVEDTLVTEDVSEKVSPDSSKTTLSDSLPSEPDSQTPFADSASEILETDASSDVGVVSPEPTATATPVTTAVPINLNVLTEEEKENLDFETESESEDVSSNALIFVEEEAPGQNCEAGGQRITSCTDSAIPRLECGVDDKFYSVKFVCHGVSSKPAPVVFAKFEENEPTNKEELKVFGLAEENSVVTLHEDEECKAKVVGEGTARQFHQEGIPVRLAANKKTVLYAKAERAAGVFSNCSSPSSAIVTDSVAPEKIQFVSLTPNVPSDDNTPVLSGLAELGSTVRVYLNSRCNGEVAAVASAEQFAAAGVEVLVDDNSKTKFSATATDAAGNTSECSAAEFVYKEQSSFENLKSTRFDGKGRYAVSDVKATKILGKKAKKFSIGQWLRYNTEQKEWAAPLGVVSNNSWNDGLGFYFKNNALHFFIKQFDKVFVAAKDVPQTEWVFVAVTFDSKAKQDNLKLYINGALVSKADHAEPLIVPKAPFEIGCLNEGTYCYDGLTDEVGIWKSVLSAKEISDLYNSGTPVSLTSSGQSYKSARKLRAYWRMGEKSDSQSVVGEVKNRNLKLKKRDKDQKVKKVK